MPRVLWNDDGGEMTSHALSLTRGIRVALGAQNVRMDRRSRSNSRSIARRRKEENTSGKEACRRNHRRGRKLGPKAGLVGVSGHRWRQPKFQVRLPPPRTPRPRPKGKQVKWVAKTTILHEAGMITGEKRAAWYKSSKETEIKGRRRLDSVGGPQRAR